MPHALDFELPPDYQWPTPAPVAALPVDLVVALLEELRDLVEAIAGRLGALECPDEES